MPRLGSRGTTVALCYVMLRYRKAADALTHALADRLHEVLPGPEYEVTIGGLAVSLRQRETVGSAICVPAVMLAKPGGMDEKLRLALEMTAEMAKYYVAPEATAHVQVTVDMLAVWWGGPTERDAVARLRPIPRQEIGL